MTDGPYCWFTQKRVRYFNGKLLTAEDFQEEQQYFRDKQRRHNRYLHGAGVVDGLTASLVGGRIQINPGLALDPEGEEILVQEMVEVPVRPADQSLYVTLRYIEREADPVPVPGSEEDSNAGYEYSRIEEGFEIGFEKENPCGGRGWEKSNWWLNCRYPVIPLARLVFRQGTWKLDRRFRPPRVR